MSEYIYLLSLSMVLGTILIVFAMRYFFAARQQRSRAISDDAYRELAQRAIAAQSENAGLLSSVQTELAQINTRLAAVEKILKAVE